MAPGIFIHVGDDTLKDDAAIQVAIAQREKKLEK
jgi:hypothetical protein